MAGATTPSAHKPPRVRYDPNPHPLRIARQKAGYSVEELSALSGVPYLSIGQLERRQRQRVYVDELVALSRALGMPWIDLVDEVNLTRPPGWRQSPRP